MPSGYTAAIKDGITFEQFVMRCSRAMGALVMMRDEPFDAPIPERFEPSSYHLEAITKLEKDLAWYQHMAESEADREAKKEFEAECDAHVRRIEEARNLRTQYVNMLDQVNEWQPPSSDHHGLKRFMVEQITGSIDFDCNTRYYETPVELTGKEWLAKKIETAQQGLAYHRQSHAEEVERTEARNTWLRQLRESIGITAART